MSTTLGAEDLRALLGTAWHGFLEPAAPPLDVQRLSRGPHHDSATVFVVRERSGTPCAVVQCAAPGAPGMVARSMQRAHAAHEVLAALGERRVLLPLALGDAAGLSCALLPFCERLDGGRLRRWWDNRRLRTPLFDWLHDIARLTRHDAPEAACEPVLTMLAQHPEVGDTLRQAAREALLRLSTGAWRPRHVLMHGDLWRGNVMLRRGPEPWRERLVVIDWAGSRADGWPFFDLVKFAESIGARGAVLRTQVERHAVVLGCEVADARSALIMALAATLARLEHFPMVTFAAMGERTLGCLDIALGRPGS
jgi:hypothetical protein